ncbi:MAG: Hpt domain-containing protein [Gammaproteobacteria bacterium]|nr:Hpt domain-containing protein [Gammaproteobacteria bacterium]
MSTYSKVDPGTLGWVKSEIDETLEQARLALEAFVENTADKTNLRFCITHLHQVVGTLLMVELDNAAMLAKETEALAEDILDEKVEGNAAVFETLTRGILVLPDTLARMQFGQPDSPLRNVALLNDLRTARGAPAISELDLFAPDLSVRPPSARTGERLTDAAFIDLTKQQRVTFQPLLLGWLRDANQKQPLRDIAVVLERLQSRTGLPAVEQLCWVARGLLEGLAEDGLASTVERKKLLSRLDQLIKKLIDGADKSQVRTGAETLTRAMLWELAHATSGGALVTQLKRAFDLDALLGSDAAVAVDEADMAAPEALRSVSIVLAKEIEVAQDLLAAYFDPEQKGAVALDPFVDHLRRIGGALEMLGLAPLKQLTDELLEVTRAILDKRIPNPQAVSMPLAEALLLVEHNTREMPRPGGDWERQIEAAARHLRALHTSGAAGSDSDSIVVSDATLSESDYKQLLGVVADEANVNLGTIEEVIENFVKDPARAGLLEDVPGLLFQIQGAAQILGQERLAELVEATRRHVDDIRGGRLPAEPAVLDGLALEIGTVGAYLDGLKHGRRNLEVLIDAALREMNAAIEGKRRTVVTPRPGTAVGDETTSLVHALRAAIEAWITGANDAATRAIVQVRIDALMQVANRPEQERLRRICEQMGNLLQLVPVGSALPPDVATTLKQSLDTLAELAGARVAAAPAPPIPAPFPAPVAPKAAPLPKEFDQEIMPIFIEDARDVLQNVTREFARWHADPDNREALTEMRRGYHTLKGSGRMVGAADIAEHAWAVERILNRLRDGKAKPTEAVFDILQRTQDALPEMIAQLEDGSTPSTNVAGLRAEAEALAEAGEALVASPKLTPPAPATKSGGDGGLPKIDRALLDIFSNEARGHLTTVRNEIAACRASGVCFVSDALFRAIHTLAGNARSLGLVMMAEASAEMEKLLHALKGKPAPMQPDHIDLLVQFEATVTELVNALNNGGGPATVLEQRFTGISRTARAAHTQVEADETGVATEEITLEAFSTPSDSIEDIELAPIPDDVGAIAGIPPAVQIAPVLPTETRAPVTESLDTADEAIDADLLDVFREEAIDILAKVEESLTRWRAKRDDPAAVLELKRALHTLKGGARMAGAVTMGNLAHGTETVLTHVEDRRLAPNETLLDLFDEIHDTLVVMLDALAQGKAAPEVRDLVARVATLLATGALPSVAPAAPKQKTPSKKASAKPTTTAPTGGLKDEVARVTPGAVAEPVPPVAEEPLRTADTDNETDGEARQAWPESMERRGQVRVSTGLLSNLVNYAGEVSIARARMEQQVYSFRDNLTELARNIARFRDQIRELEIQSESQILYRLEQQGEAVADQDADFDPLEFDRFTKLQQLSRQLAESLHDLTTIQGSLGNFIGEAQTALLQQARINTELQEGLMRTRMVGFNTLAGRLRHIVRTTARELGKRVELNLVGAEVEVDRNMLERMVGPFEHMIRNAIDHGMEPESTRARAGKPAAGRITIATAQEASEIVIRFADDGAGLNIDAIRAKAIERGMMPQDAMLSEEELIQFILAPGFSTAREITHFSGRGVGMDVVHTEVKQLGGSMSVDSQRGAGTTFIIRLPLTLSITQALMVHVGDQLFAVPLAAVVNIVEYPVEQLNNIAVGKNPLLNYRDQVYPYMNLSTRLGLAGAQQREDKVPILLVRTGTREVAIQVDGLRGTREVVIKALGPQLAELKGLAGATILGDGRVVLILDVAGLWYRDDVIHFERPGSAKVAVEEARARPVVMVVDDSLTVRKITSKHLQKRGLDVMVAKDGVDAVEQLRERVPDLMLVDIEMPRMDGYELTARVRSDSRLKHIPIIIITSRAGTKHRQKALELGVDMYMSKPYQEEELFKNIDSLLASGHSI